MDAREVAAQMKDVYIPLADNDPRLIDILGIKIGRLTVLDCLGFREYGKKKQKIPVYNCICECGNSTPIMRPRLTGKNKTESCGCFQKEKLGKMVSLHNETRSEFYSSWAAMKERCNREYHPQYSHYGGRGIKYNGKWEFYLGFREDMYDEYIKAQSIYPNEKLSLERIDVNGNYEKYNCTFIPLNKQNLNRRSNRCFLAINPSGIEFISDKITEFAFENGLVKNCIIHCLKGRNGSHKKWKFFYLD